jgi:hypothetical protein
MWFPHSRILQRALDPSLPVMPQDAGATSAGSLQVGVAE